MYQMNHLHHARHKMHKGEVAFHIAVPLAIALATVAMGYYVVMLVFSILKLA